MDTTATPEGQVPSPIIAAQDVRCGDAAFVLMMVLTVGLFGLLGVMCFHEVPPGSRDLMNVILGSVATAWVAGVNYFFGSSVSSKAKDSMIAAQISPNKA